MKDLGVVFTSDLKFDVHIKNSISKAYRNLGFIIRQGKIFKNNSTLVNLYFSFVRSHLEYNSIVWYPSSLRSIKLIEAVQIKLLKSLYLRNHGVYPFMVANSQLLKEFKLNSLQQRRDIASLVYLHKILNGLASNSYLLSKISLYVPAVTGRPRQIFYIPRVHTVQCYNSPLLNMLRKHNEMCKEVNIFGCSCKLFVNAICSYRFQ